MLTQSMDSGYAQSIARTAPIDCGLELDAASAPKHPPINMDDWELTDRLKRIERLLARRLSNDSKASPTDLSNTKSWQRRTDPPHAQLPADFPAVFASTAKYQRQSENTIIGLWVVWLLAFAGTAVWSIGTAALAGVPAIAGIVGDALVFPLQSLGIGLLLVGIFIAIGQSVSASRRLTRRLAMLDVATTDLRSASAYQNAASGAPAFYAALARGASPHMLLTDIKGQLDQLTLRMINDAQR